MSTEDIKLRKVDEPEFNSLPRNVKLVFVGDRPIFVKKVGMHFMPLTASEQEILRNKHIMS